jgi:hypothetical protein
MWRKPSQERLQTKIQGTIGSDLISKAFGPRTNSKDYRTQACPYFDNDGRPKTTSLKRSLLCNTPQNFNRIKPDSKDSKEIQIENPMSLRLTQRNWDLKRMRTKDGISTQKLNLGFKPNLGNQSARAKNSNPSPYSNLKYHNPKDTLKINTVTAQTPRGPANPPKKLFSSRTHRASQPTFSNKHNRLTRSP